tara:strand:+ start:449 stop:619 length:171 start_codon:yes stop_codon:yes gene_type:complete
MKPKERDKIEAADRVELFHSFLINYIIHHSVYKLNKDFAKHIDIAVENLERAKLKI